MLKAKNIKGGHVYSFELEVKPEFDIFCPECSTPVIFKNGSVKVAHFAHKPNSDCSFGTRESESHMLMKKNFYEMVKRKYPAADITIEDNTFNNRRADISIHGKDKKVVVEFQASKISIDEIIKRTTDYNKQGAYVLWVFHISRIRSEAFFEKGEKRIPHELLIMEKFGLLQMMSDGSQIRKLKLTGGRETKYMRKCAWEVESELIFKFIENVFDYNHSQHYLKFATLDYEPNEYPNHQHFKEQRKLKNEKRRLEGDPHWFWSSIEQYNV